MISSGDSFKSGKIPEAIFLHGRKKGYAVWDTLRNAISDILLLEKQEFQAIKIVLPSGKGRVIRRGTRIGCDESAYRKLFDQKLIVYGNYLHNLSEQFITRFHLWSQCLILCNEAFHFETSDVSAEARKNSDNLWNVLSNQIPCWIRKNLRSEYVTFLLNASKA